MRGARTWLPRFLFDFRFVVPSARARRGWVGGAGRCARRLCAAALGAAALCAAGLAPREAWRLPSRPRLRLARPRSGSAGGWARARVWLVSRPGPVHSGPSPSTALRLAPQETSSFKVGTPPPPNPSGIPLGRRAVPFVLGGGGVPTSMQHSITGDHIGPAHTHGANKTCIIIEIDVFWGADRSPTDRTDSLISGISGAQKRRQKDRKITDPLDSH